MESGKSKTALKIRGLNDVGRYARGVQWIDGHDSISPLENLRRWCPRNVCGGRIDGEIPARASAWRNYRGWATWRYSWNGTTVTKRSIRSASYAICADAPIA